MNNERKLKGVLGAGADAFAGVVGLVDSAPHASVTNFQWGRTSELDWTDEGEIAMRIVLNRAWNAAQMEGWLRQKGEPAHALWAKRGDGARLMVGFTNACPIVWMDATGAPFLTLATLPTASGVERLKDGLIAFRDNNYRWFRDVCFAREFPGHVLMPTQRGATG